MNDKLLQSYLVVTDAIAQDASPETAYRAVERAIGELIGHGTPPSEQPGASPVK